MSISRVRTFLEKSGCATAVGVIIAIVLISGVVSFMGPGSGAGASGGPGGANDPANAVAMIGDFAVTPDAVENMAQGQIQQYIAQIEELPPSIEANVYGSAIQESLNAGLLLEVAKRRNINTSNEAVMDAYWNMAVEGERQSLISANELKAGASATEFDAAIKKKHGKTLQELKTEMMKNLGAELQKPDIRPMIVSRASNDMIMAAIEKQQPVTDDRLKESYNSKVTKRIFLNQEQHKGEDLVKRAEEIMAELNSGTINFEAAMEKYSDEPAAKGKTKKENTFIVAGTTLILDKEFAPIVPLQPNEMAIVKMPTGVSIFKVLYVQPELPADFETKKEEYRKSLSTMLAANTMQDELRKLREDANVVKWNSEGFHVLYDWYQTQTNADLLADPSVRKSKMEELDSRAQKAADSDPFTSGARVAALVAFSTHSDNWNALTPTDKKSRADERIEALDRVLSVTANVDLRLELVDLLAEKKDGARVAEQLTNAVQGIQGAYSQNAERKWRDINGKVLALEKSGVLAKDKAEEIQKALDQWKADKAAAAKQEAEEKKLMEEEQKKAEAEAKKQAEADKKKGTTGSTTGSTTGGAGSPSAPAPKTTGG